MKRILLTGAMLFSLLSVTAQTKTEYQKLDSLMQLRKYYSQEIGLIDLKIQDIIFELTNDYEPPRQDRATDKPLQTTAQPASQSSTKYSSPSSPPPTYQSSAPKQSSTSQRKYYTGSKGGCYYLTASGKKVYVDRSYCN